MKKLGSGMLELTPLQRLERENNLGKLAQDLEHVPWTRLRKLREHKYGYLKAWPKLRSIVGEWPTEWAQVAWRPLASYSSHHWAGMISMVGRWCTAVVRELNWGDGIECPREFVEEVEREMEGMKS